MTSTTVSVSVGVDPATTFTAFTEELDQWWVRGPINYFDSARALGMRCEPGVGGRLVEVYDGATGEGYELGRITVWEPGKRLAWASSVDDVEIEVRFEATASGTDVTVEATIPDDGADRGGTAWVRVVPKWFGPWIARRDSAPGPQRELARLAVGVYYEKPATAARWLASAFGFESPDPLPDGPDALPDNEYGPPWIEFRVGNGSLMVFKLDSPAPPSRPRTRRGCTSTTSTRISPAPRRPGRRSSAASIRPDTARTSPRTSKGAAGRSRRRGRGKSDGS